MSTQTLGPPPASTVKTLVSLLTLLSENTTSTSRRPGGAPLRSKVESNAELFSTKRCAPDSSGNPSPINFTESGEVSKLSPIILIVTEPLLPPAVGATANMSGSPVPVTLGTFRKKQPRLVEGSPFARGKFAERV